MGKGIRIIHENCDPDQATDTTLPYSAFLVEYEVGEETRWDITMAGKQSEIFDHYYDTYGIVKNLTQSKGKMNPKLWSPPGSSKKK